MNPLNTRELIMNVFTNAILNRVIQVAFLMVFLFCYSASGETHITQDIDEDQTWDLSGSPYWIGNAVDVLEGVTLTILPGVGLRGYPLRILGTLNADGMYAPWGNSSSFVFRGNSSGAIINSALLSAVSVNLELGSPSVTMTDCTLGTYYHSCNVYCNGGTLSMSGCTLRNATVEDGLLSMSGCTLDNISLVGGTPTVSGCTFLDAYPIQLGYPHHAIGLGGINNNTYINPNPICIRIQNGVIEGTANLIKVDGIRKYQLSNDVGVPPGSVLNIDPNGKANLFL